MSSGITRPLRTVADASQSFDCLCLGARRLAKPPMPPSAKELVGPIPFAPGPQSNRRQFGISRMRHYPVVARRVAHSVARTAVNEAFATILAEQPKVLDRRPTSERLSRQRFYRFLDHLRRSAPQMIDALSSGILRSVELGRDLMVRIRQRQKIWECAGLLQTPGGLVESIHHLFSDLAGSGLVRPS